jgi:ADP-ribosyl-[dinitrogen reductase] hydrolase
VISHDRAVPSESVDLVTDRLEGTLLGVALGDALGLPCEGMSARSIARRFGTVDRFRLLGRTGFVSDDTEQTALIAQSLVRHPRGSDACVRAFRRALLGWFCRLPWGVGWATVRSCVRIALGISPSGVMSAGNGAAMRAAIVGVFFHDQTDHRRAFGRVLAQVTHRDERAVEGALFVAELAACLVRAAGEESVKRCVAESREIVTNTELNAALEGAVHLAADGVTTTEGAQACGTTGFVVHTVPFAVFCLLRYGGDPMRALSEAIGAGGDTDSIAAILGGWLGARHGTPGLPASLLARIHDGPFGPSHLRALAVGLGQARQGIAGPVPRYSATGALARNLALYPVVLFHGFRRLVPF